MSSTATTKEAKLNILMVSAVPALQGLPLRGVPTDRLSDSRWTKNYRGAPAGVPKDVINKKSVKKSPMQEPRRGCQLSNSTEGCKMGASGEQPDKMLRHDCAGEAYHS